MSKDFISFTRAKPPHQIMDGLFCSLSFFMFVSVFCFPNNWKINGDYPPPGGQCNSFLVYMSFSPTDEKCQRIFFDGIFYISWNLLSVGKHRPPPQDFGCGCASAVKRSRSLILKGLRHSAEAPLRRFGRLTFWRDALRRGPWPARRPGRASWLPSFPNRC